MTSVVLYSQRLHHDRVIIERYNNAQGKRLHQRERRQEHEIPRVCVALPIQETEVDDCTEERNIEGPSTTECKSVVGSAMEAETYCV